MIHEDSDSLLPRDELRSTRAIYALRDEMFDKGIASAQYAACHVWVNALPYLLHVPRHRSPQPFLEAHLHRVAQIALRTLDRSH